MARLIINGTFLGKNSSGIGQYFQCLLGYLEELNPSILCSDIPPKFKSFGCIRVSPKLSADGGTKSHLKRLLWTQFRLGKICKAVQSSSILFSPIPEAPLWSGTKGIVMIHDFIPLRFPNWRSPLYPYHRFYVPEVARQSTHLICNSEATARDIVKFTGVSAKKISPILLGYDAQHFQPVVQNFHNITPYFLYLGRHDPHKNIARIIDAFYQGNFSRETELWLVGSQHPRHSPALHQQIAELGLTERVKFLDYVPYGDLPGIISGAIALVFPSLWEGFGLPILEAMGCGTPVITANVASMPEVAGDAAILVDPYNTAQIADAMAQVAHDASVRSQLSALGLARAKLFSWEKTGRETAEVLQRFL